jgi:hypothetical protein
MNTIPIFLLHFTAIFAFVDKIYSSFKCAKQLTNLPFFLSITTIALERNSQCKALSHCNKYSLDGSFWYALIMIQYINNCGFEPDKINGNNIDAKARMLNTRSPISRGSKTKKLTMRS